MPICFHAASSMIYFPWRTRRVLWQTSITVLTEYLDQTLVYGFPVPFVAHPPQKKIVSYLLSISWSGPRKGGNSNCNLKFSIVKRENMNESGPARIEVVRIFGPNLVSSCLGPLVVHM